MKSEYIARTATCEDVPLDGITSRDVYLSCFLMLTAIIDWWGQDPAMAEAIIGEAEEAVRASGHALAAVGS